MQIVPSKHGGRGGNPVWLAALAYPALAFGAGCVCMKPASDSGNPLPVVKRVDLKRYQGTWYEIARYPTRFQRGCEAVTATYTLRNDGKVRVVNRCRKGSPAGKERSAEGTAWVVDSATNAKLKVRFFWPFCGDYWIIALGPDYDYAVVGHPNRKYLWILSRTPRLKPSTLANILEKIPGLGYDPKKLRYTRHGDAR